MGIQKLAHYSIRTTDLEASRKFYTEVMGFKVGYRPDFKFPGLWLYRGGDEHEFGIVHIIDVNLKDREAVNAYLGDKPADNLQGTGTLDHIAFFATGLAEMRERLAGLKVEFMERTVPSLGLHQVFLTDPSDVTIELNYSSEEAQSANG